MDKGQASLLLKEAYEKLKASDAIAAYSFMENALDFDYENEEIKHALKCVRWWLDQTRRIDDLKNPYEKGAFLISLLKQYFAFLESIKQGAGFEQCQYAVRYFIYSRALFFFSGLLSNPANTRDPGLLHLTGRCYKGLGNYDEALNYLEQAVSINKEDAEILAELADVNAMISQTKDAKALFREAFFIDPLKIDIRFMESALILKLRDKVAELGFKDEALSEWIPVYGYIWKVFSVKRELKQLELGRLKQAIFSMEAEYNSNLSRRSVIKPRLLNHYFRLVDYYEIVHDNSSLLEETLLKIKLTDPDIYNMYTG